MSKTCPFLLAAWITRYGAEAERPTDIEQEHTACLGEDCGKFAVCQGQRSGINLKDLASAMCDVTSDKPDHKTCKNCGGECVGTSWGEDGPWSMICDECKTFLKAAWAAHDKGGKP